MSQQEIEQFIDDVLDNKFYKEQSQIYLNYIEQSNQEKMNLILNATKKCIQNKQDDPVRFLNSLRLIKDCYFENNSYFNEQIKTVILEDIKQIAMFAYNSKSETRGADLLGNQLDSKLKAIGNTAHRISLEAIIVWNRDSLDVDGEINEFKKAYKECVHIGVQFPQQLKYFIFKEVKFKQIDSWKQVQLLHEQVIRQFKQLVLYQSPDFNKLEELNQLNIKILTLTQNMSNKKYETGDFQDFEYIKKQAGDYCNQYNLHLNVEHPNYEQFKQFFDTNYQEYTNMLKNENIDIQDAQQQNLEQKEYIFDKIQIDFNNEQDLQENQIEQFQKIEIQDDNDSQTNLQYQKQISQDKDQSPKVNIFSQKKPLQMQKISPVKQRNIRPVSIFGQKQKVVTNKNIFSFQEDGLKFQEQFTKNLSDSQTQSLSKQSEPFKAVQIFKKVLVSSQNLENFQHDNYDKLISELREENQKLKLRNIYLENKVLQQEQQILRMSKTKSNKIFDQDKQIKLNPQDLYTNLQKDFKFSETSIQMVKSIDLKKSDDIKNKQLIDISSLKFFNPLEQLSNQDLFKKACLKQKSVLFENQNLQIGTITQLIEQSLQIDIFLGNKTNVQIDLNIDIQMSSDTILKCSNMIKSIKPKNQEVISITFNFESQIYLPNMATITYDYGFIDVVKTFIPTTINKFMKMLPVHQSQFESQNLNFQSFVSEEIFLNQNILSKSSNFTKLFPGFVKVQDNSSSNIDSQTYIGSFVIKQSQYLCRFVFIQNQTFYIEIRQNKENIMQQGQFLLKTLLYLLS